MHACVYIGGLLYRHLPHEPLLRNIWKYSLHLDFMLSRMVMVGIMPLLVCTLAALTSEASNVWWTGDVGFVNEAYGNFLHKHQQHEFTSYRSRLASFNRASDQVDDWKRKVPTGPNCDHNRYSTSPSPSNSIDPSQHNILAPPPCGDDNNKRTPPSLSNMYWTSKNMLVHACMETCTMWCKMEACVCKNWVFAECGKINLPSNKRVFPFSIEEMHSYHRWNCSCHSMIVRSN
jgi:hypothetical protein